MVSALLSAICRLVQAWRSLREHQQDDRFLVEQWKSAFKPAPPKVLPFRNLMPIRGAKDVWKRRVA